MLNKKYRKYISILIALVILILNTSIVKAEIAYSSYLQHNIYSYTYYDRAAVHTNSTSGWASTEIYTSGYTNVPVGYMGAASQLLTVQGAICRVASMVYNSTSTSALGVSTTTHSSSTGYYSIGITAYYNGSGYTNYMTTTTPTLYLGSSLLSSSLNAPVIEYAENDNGQTIGSAYIAAVSGEMPDLVMAVTVDGKTGYVYAGDIAYDMPANPEEAVAMNAVAASNPTIPVYAEDGTTVIGYFQFTTIVE